MGDVAEKRVGNRIYRVHGLQERAESIRAASRRVSDSISASLAAARLAVADWRGPLADAFVVRMNSVTASMVTLQLAGEDAAARCAMFPAEPYYSSVGADYSYRGARIDAPASNGTVSADPESLHDYARATADQGGRFTGLAAAVTTDGLSADVSVQRSLNATEREQWQDQGVPAIEIAMALVWSDPQPVPVTEVFGLPDLTGQAALVSSDADALGTWVTAVAFALETADQALVALLLAHPELAGYLDHSAMTAGRTTGEVALMVVLANLAQFDVAGGGDHLDGVVGGSDLEAIANDETADAHLRAAAQYLLANRLFLSQASIIDLPMSYEVWPDEVRLTSSGISRFLEYNAAIRAVGLDFDRLDTAADGGRTDGYVSPDDLAAAAANVRFPASLRDAAGFLLANPMLTQRLGLYANANLDRWAVNMMFQVPLTNDAMGFSRNAVIALAVDQQAYASDPAAANRFVLGLPMADRDGDGGLPLTLVTDEGLRALANAALSANRYDLSGQHAVIAHLPETGSWGNKIGAVEQRGGVRNELITGFYDLMAHRADELFAGPALAERPETPGHPGANWLMFAPWASSGVGQAITGESTGPFGMTTDGVQQAAADGNQWIFNDIGGRFTAFLEMYEQSPVPSEAQLERFFANTFEDGDGTIRNAFAAYVGAIGEDDPVRRQLLMFQGNTLIATHEQAGAQPYLERMALGPDEIVTGLFPPLQVGSGSIHVKEDMPDRTTGNNYVESAALLSLDPGLRSAVAFSGGPTQFQVGAAAPVAGVVDLDAIAGIELFRPDFSPSTADWFLGGGGNLADPESLAGSGASSWPDWDERMYSILRMFEQYHTDPTLFDTTLIDASLSNVGWLDAGLGLGG